MDGEIYVLIQIWEICLDVRALVNEIRYMMGLSYVNGIYLTVIENVYLVNLNPPRVYLALCLIV